MSPQKNTFDANSILRRSSIIVDQIRQLVTDDEGQIVGLKNGLKQMLAQSGQFGTATIKIGSTTIKAVLTDWTPAREGIGYDGEKVVPHGISASLMNSKYFSGFKSAETATKESAYLIAFLAMSILNGRTPTTGAPNLETSHKANWLRQLVNEFGENIRIESVTIPGSEHKTTGYQFPELTTDHETIMAIANYASGNSQHMIAFMGRKPMAREGLDRGADNSILNM